MARYAENREQNRDVKYLYKVWSKVDSGVELPPTLTGDALLPLLKDIPEPALKEKMREATPKARQPYRRIRFSPHVFSWKSGATYAAAMVLIVALASSLGRGTPADIQEGVIEMQPAESAQATDELGNQVAPFAFGEAVEDSAADSAAPAGDGRSLPQDAPAVAEAPTQPPATEPPAEAMDAASIDYDDNAAKGGPGVSIELGQAGDYTFNWRANDPSDPDKGAYPVTVNVIHTSTGVSAFEIDIQELRTVDQYVVYEGVLTLVGGSVGQDGVVVKSFDLSQVGNHQEVYQRFQPGALLDVRNYQNVLSLITFASADQSPGCEVVPLPDSVESGQCIISTIDLATMTGSQKAFSGASQDLSPGNRNIYVQYEGEPSDENPSGRYVAHIRLNGTEIELRSSENGAAHSTETADGTDAAAVEPGVESATGETEPTSESPE